MPVAFQRMDEFGSRVPVATLPFHIGTGIENELVVVGKDVRPRHARIRYVKGEYMISAQDEAPLWVNNESTPFMVLRDGDQVAMADPQDPDGERFIFRNRLEGTFIPPGASIAQAWSAHPGSAEKENGPLQFGEGHPVDNRDPEKVFRVLVPARGGSLLIKRIRAVSDPEAGDAALRLLGQLAGASHPNLAPMVDGGLERRQGTISVWMATRWVDGVPAKKLVASGGVDAPKAIDILQGAARAVSHLHGRGLLHRDVTPGNVIRRERGDGVLIDLGSVVRNDPDAEAAKGVVGTPGFVAPEIVRADGGPPTPAADIYGLAAVGYALLTGTPPVTDVGDVLDMLAQSGRMPPRLQDMGLEVSPALEGLLFQALMPDPAARPDAEQFVAILDLVSAELGL